MIAQTKKEFLKFKKKSHFNLTYIIEKKVNLN